MNGVGLAQVMHRQYDTLHEGCSPGCGVLNTMRLSALLFTVVLIASPALAQPPVATVAATAPEDTNPAEETKATPAVEHQLPVSIDKIREALETTPLLSLRTIDERPTFRIQIQEKRKLEELLGTLKFKSVLVPAGGLYQAELDRIQVPATDYPLRQPYAAFNESQLLTIAVENLVRAYLGGKALNAVSHAERAHAEEAARDEVRAAVSQYCAAQPRNGAGIQICDTPVR
jgi:hypothetical protein